MSVESWNCAGPPRVTPGMPTRIAVVVEKNARLIAVPVVVAVVLCYASWRLGAAFWRLKRNKWAEG